jgi:hypothetical protein
LAGGGDHVVGQLRAGGELDGGGDTGLFPALGVTGPGLGQVDPAVDQGVSVFTGVGQEDADLGVLDPSRGAGVLALDTDGMDALWRADGYAAVGADVVLFGGVWLSFAA